MWRRDGAVWRMAGFAIGDNVDKNRDHATDQLTYTLECQGDDVAGGCHGVRFGPSSQSVSCGHEIRDRRQTRRRRPGSSLQPVPGISWRHLLSSAGPAAKAKIRSNRTASAQIARALSQSAIGRGKSLPSLPSRSGLPGHWQSEIWPGRKQGGLIGHWPTPRHAKTPASGGLGL